MSNYNPSPSHTRRVPCDHALTTLSEVVPEHSHITAAVGQLILTDGRNFRIEPSGNLRVPYALLRDLEFGRDSVTGTPLRLCPDTSSDLRPFMEQPCVSGATATLIGPKYVLTVAHYLILTNIFSHKLVFGRSASDEDVVFEKEPDATGRRWATISAERVYSAKRLVAYVDYPPFQDWAVLELDREVQEIEPLRVGRYDRGADTLLVGHPLGLPLKCTKTIPIEPDLSTPPSYQIFGDNGSGGSGSALVQAGTVVGVLRGDVQLDSRTIRREGIACLDPGRVPCERPQPFTPSIHFAPALPHITGW